jgi:Mce-associated membrane protein
VTIDTNTSSTPPAAAEDDGQRDADATDDRDSSTRRFASTRSALWYAVVASIVTITALAGVGGWLGWRLYQDVRVEHAHAQLLGAARQGALNLTTIDWQQPGRDVARILASATGKFYDDFSARAQPFIDVVKQAHSTSVGTVTAAGIESSTDNTAQVLVAVSVRISNAGAAEQQPRAWRMRLTVEKVGGDVKVSNVEFVP